MSDTPRTDEVEHPFRQRNDQTYTRLLEHARQLERELNAARPEGETHKGFILVPDEPVMWRREWDGDVSDIGAWVYAEEYEETFDGQQWQPLYAKQQK